VAAFGPDYVVLTDSWCFKPHLAEAAAGRPYFLRFHAAETACPLNNLRVQANPDGSFADCPHHFLGEPSACLACLEAHRALAPGPPGNLHHTERLLAGVQAGREYHARLREALQQAQGLLVYNRTLQELFAPYHPRTYVVPSGVDRSRFVNLPLREPDPPVKTLLFAGVAEEPVKGYDVLLAAFTRLLRQRRDVHLQVTADPPGPVTDYVTFTGWQSQEDLPSVYAQADVCVVPSVWAEAFGIVAVEAMAAGKPVVASRTGGLAETVVEGETGLLFERGNAAELADKITVLLDDPARRERLGRAGQARVGERYTWEKVIQRYYRPLFQGEEPASSSS
jgi:glycosyltransferase involved in cell wall biosynthesis